MKKLLLLTLFISTTLLSKAQLNNGKNVAKVNLSSFVFKGIGVQYERQIGKRVTLGLGYNTIPNSPIAFRSFVDEYAGETEGVKVGEFRLGTSIITPELRWYVGRRGAFHGFYFAPYARFGSYNIQGPVEVDSDNNTKRNINFDGKLNAVTGGLMIGSQFKLSKRLYLDWWILGASIGNANGDLIAATPLSETEQQDLRQVLSSVNIPFTTIEYDVNSNGARVKTNGDMAGIRGLGINLGIRF